MFTKIYKTFFRGLIGILPLTLTVYFIVWFFNFLDNIFKNIIYKIIPFNKYIPGFSILVGVVCIFAFGVLLKSDFFKQFFQAIQKPLKKFPLIKTIYAAIEDLMFFFNNDGEHKNQIVLIKNEKLGGQMIGLLTRENLQKINSCFEDDLVAVYLPMSYAFGGYTVFVNKNDITFTDLKVESAMKSAVTGWVKKE